MKLKPNKKRFLRPKEAFLSILKKSQKWSKIVKKLRLTPLLLVEIWPFWGLFSKPILSRNIHPMKLKPSKKRFLRPKEPFFSLLKNSQKWSKIVKKLRLTPFFWSKFGHFWDFFQSPFCREIYVQ